jgi:hypothetical protein
VKDLSDLLRTLNDLPGELQNGQIKGVNKASFFVTKSIRDQVRTATGGDMKMSGVGKNGAKIGARYGVKGKVNPTGRITATGKAFPLLDRDTDPHAIPKPRRRRKKVLRFADGNFRASVRHPGTHGKHMWDKGIRRAAPKTQGIFEEEIHKAVVRAVR